MKIHNYGNDYAYQLKQKQNNTTESNVENPISERSRGDVGAECRTSCEKKEEAQKENQSGDGGCAVRTDTATNKNAKKKKEAQTVSDSANEKKETEI